jgi:phosphoglycolate phosphatase
MFKPTSKLCILDCDGTLVDSQQPIIEAMSMAFRRQGLDEPTPASVKRLVGLPLADAVAALLDDGSENLVRVISDAYRAAYGELRRANGSLEPLFPGMIEALDALAVNGWRLAIATGKSKVGVLATLRHHDLVDRFQSIQTPDNAAGKPAPDMVFRALEETGADACAAVVVGDTAYDMLMATNAGVAGLGVTWGYHNADELHASGAAAVIDRVDQLASHADMLTEFTESDPGVPAAEAVTSRDVPPAMSMRTPSDR